MKAVLVGTDLMYRQDGQLVPIEINTNTGWDDSNRVETLNDVFDLSVFVAYIREHNITKVYLEGLVNKIESRLREAIPEIEVVHIFAKDLETLEEGENELVVRTAYSPVAAVDSFCRDKIQFLEAIKNQDFSSEFIYRENGELKGAIENFVDNGVLPNYIVKYRYPDYDKAVYPKFLRVESVEELRSYAEENLLDNYFIMPFYYNEEKLWNRERIVLIRNWSLAIVNEEGSLDSVEIGKYTKLTANIQNASFDYNEQKELDNVKAKADITTVFWYSDTIGDVLLDENDLVWMADGSWKLAQDLKVGDAVKSLELPTDVDLKQHAGDTNISLEDWEGSSKYVSEPVAAKNDGICQFVDKVTVAFSDGTDWYDTAKSSYPVLDEDDNSVVFKLVKDLQEGDKVLLVKIDEETPVYEIKEVVALQFSREIVNGFSITLANKSHLFLTRTSEDQTAYASIEHNDVIEFLAYYFYRFRDTYMVMAVDEQDTQDMYRNQWCEDPDADHNYTGSVFNPFEDIAIDYGGVPREDLGLMNYNSQVIGMYGAVGHEVHLVDPEHPEVEVVDTNTNDVYVSDTASMMEAAMPDQIGFVVNGHGRLWGTDMYTGSTRFVAAYVPEKIQKYKNSVSDDAGIDYLAGGYFEDGCTYNSQEEFPVVCNTSILPLMGVDTPGGVPSSTLLGEGLARYSSSEYQFLEEMNITYPYPSVICQYEAPLFISNPASQKSSAPTLHVAEGYIFTLWLGDSLLSRLGADSAAVPMSELELAQILCMGAISDTSDYQENRIYGNWANQGAGYIWNAWGDKTVESTNSWKTKVYPRIEGKQYGESTTSINHLYRIYFTESDKNAMNLVDNQGNRFATSSFYMGLSSTVVPLNQNTFMGGLQSVSDGGMTVWKVKSENTYDCQIAKYLGVPLDGYHSLADINNGWAEYNTNFGDPDFPYWVGWPYSIPDYNIFQLYPAYGEGGSNQFYTNFQYEYDDQLGMFWETYENQIYPIVMRIRRYWIA